MAASSSPSFNALYERVESGRLRVVFVLGLARGGTTCVEKYLYETLAFDAQINEPSLVGPPRPRKQEEEEVSQESRMEVTFNRVVSHVERLEEEKKFMTILVKEVSNKVLPAMIPFWAKLCSRWIVVVRNPLLQMESRLKSMLDRVDSEALVSLGVFPDALARAMAVHGKKVFTTPSAALDTWKVRYRSMKRDRNFEGLGPGAMRACALHPFFEWPEVQAEVLGRDVALPLDEFLKLSDEECAEVLAWRLGWAPLRRQLDALEGSNIDLVIVDFSSFQMDPSDLAEWVADRAFDGAVGGDENDSKKMKKKAFETCANGQDWTEASWEKWYATPCFSKASASRAIDPVSKRPLEMDRFPSFVRARLREACAAWADLVVCDARALRPPRPALRAPFLGLDPLHDALCAAKQASWRTVRARRWRGRERALDAALISLEQRDHPSWPMLLDVVCSLLVVIAQAWMLFQCGLAFLWEQRVRLVATPWLVFKRGEYPLAEDALLSVVIPAHNEAATIKDCVEAVLKKAKDKVEVVVVDAGSTDGTKQVLETAFPNDEILVVSYLDGGGRGPALNAGAKAANGALLLFLHADTIVPPHYDWALRLGLEDPKTEILAFGFETSLPRDTLLAAVLEASANFRSRRFQLPWGDQGLAITKRRFDALDGFRPIPLFEDLDLVVRARALGAYRGRRIITLDDVRVVTSARRYLHNAVTQNFLNAALVFRWHLGATPSQLFRHYYGTPIALQPSVEMKA
ncbi:hypothetical protein CTAYLR_007960 [Chrysophaeum taylorii]|uniref:Glycosyltransferase 2-like domain-containing protein n=1 Tax=Chrysophaeum taylorii TaxID=2483200 RepID=A0AAD7XK11_9STRA|nr:hypothetical protein CTAYLR_007960 [Chrysophaeum taylorii]